MGKKSSPLWKAMDEKQERFHCKHCQASFSKSTGLSSIDYHIKKNHQEAYEVLIKEDFDNRKAGHERVVSKISEQTDASDRAIDKKILAKFVATANVSPRILQNLWFRAFIYRLQPSYVVPSYKTIDREGTILHDYLKESTYNVVKEKNFVLSTDCWSSKNADYCVMSLIVHFMRDDFTRSNTVLAVVDVQPPKTAENLHKCMKDTLNGMGPGPCKNLIGAVTDGDYSTRKSIRLFGIESVRCCGHAIHLICQKVCTVGMIPNIIEKAKQVISRLHRSPIIKRNFFEESRSLDLPGKKFRSFSETRWLAAITLIQDIAEYNEVLKCVESLEILALDEEEEKCAKFIVEIAPLYQNTLNEVERDESCISEVIPSLQHIVHTIKQTEEYGDSNNQNNAVALKMVEETEFRLSEFTSSQISVCSLYFHPCLVNVDVLPSGLAWSDVKERVISFFDENKEKFPVDIPGEVLRKAPTAKKFKSFFNTLGHDSSTSTTPSTIYQKLEAEMRDYERMLTANRPRLISNVSIWWKSREDDFQLLSKMALFFSLFPASSAQNERVFSKCGIILGNKRRTSMKAETLEKWLIIGYDGAEEQISMMSESSGATETPNIDLFDQSFCDILEDDYDHYSSEGEERGEIPVRHNENAIQNTNDQIDENSNRQPKARTKAKKSYKKDPKL